MGLLPLAILCCFAPADQAPPVLSDGVRLRGQVVAKGTRQPLAGASITVDAVPAGAAGPDGHFEVDVLEGRRRIGLQYPGYEPLEETVTAAAGSPEHVFRLIPGDAPGRYETVVTPPAEQAPRTQLRDEQMRTVPGSLGDPFRVMESLPGVSQVVWPLAMYTVRGANPGNTGFFLDGVRVPMLFHFALGPSVIHPFFIDKVDFYPGGYPAEYGRFVSGIVAARTTAPKTDRLHASADMRLFDAGGIVAAPWHGGRGTVAVAGRYSYTGLLATALQNDFVLGYWDYQLRVDRRAGPGRVSVFAFGSSDVLGYRVQEQDDSLARTVEDARVSFHRLTVDWSGALGHGRAEAGLLLGQSAAASSIRALLALPVQVTTATVASRLGYERQLATWAGLRVGADAEAQRFLPHSELDDRQDVFRQRDAVSVSSHVSMIVRSGTWLSVTPAMRADVFFEQGTRRLEPGPRFTVRARPVGDLWLKAAVGRYAQMASLPLSVPGFESFGLKDYGTQSSVQGSVGAEAPVGQALTLDVTGFVQRLKLTDLASQFNYDLQQGSILEKRDGRSWGVELMLRRAVTERLSGWLAYTLSKSERVVGAYRTRTASDWDQRHIMNLVVAYRLRGGLKLGARWHINTGRPYPVFDQVTNRAEYQRLPDFHQLDVRVDKRFFFDRFALDVYAEVVNTTLSRQVYDRKLEANGAVNDRSYRIVLPSVGVHADW
jgi:hypothetical protein